MPDTTNPLFSVQLYGVEVFWELIEQLAPLRREHSTNQYGDIHLTLVSRTIAVDQEMNLITKRNY